MKGAVMPQKIYPRSKDKETVYLKGVISNPNIIIGDYTMYNDFVREPKDFEKNNVLYQYPINQDKLIIGKFCSIACGAKFIFNSANHSLSSLSTYPFPIFFEEWNLDVKDITKAWNNKGNIIIGNDVWIGYEAVVCFLQALFPQKCRLTSSKLHGEFPQYCISSAGTLSGAGEEPLQAYKVY